jgi:glycosyltransferase involved in cell wall biosynthesis
MTEGRTRPPGTGWRIVPLGPDSLADLTAFFAAFTSSGSGNFFHPHPLDRAEAERLCGRPGKDYYCLAYVDAEVAGYGMLRGWDEGYAEPSLGVALLPGFRGVGLGRKLTEHLHAEAARRGAASVRLKVYSSNRAARDLYATLGYVFAPQADGVELGRLELAPALKVGILVQGLAHWAGGLDFLCGLINALLAAPSARHAELTVLLPSQPPRRWSKAHFKEIEDWLKGLLRRKRGAPRPGMESVRDRLAGFGPRLRLVEIGSDAAAHREAARELGLQVVFPCMRPADFGPRCGVVGYLYDFQHRHLPDFFTRVERSRRDRRFRELLTGVDAVVVNARSVASDIREFVPESTAQVFTLPFAPITRREWLEARPDLVAKYGLTDPYLIVCNQFWEHKDHRTAFRAFARIAADHPGVKLVCTGSPLDSRSPAYFPSLQEELRRLGIADRVQILGLIPKRDQIELLKQAVALVQPTLFEGGPGGGAAYDAVGLDVPVILSDIAVNREVDCGKVTLFPAGDAEALAEKMRAALRAKPTRLEAAALLAQSQAKAEGCGETIWRALMVARKA